MKRIVFISLLITWSCNIYKKNDSNYNFKIKNNTIYYIENIQLFNTKFKNLDANQSTEYISISYITIKDNAIFSLDSKGKTFNMYIDNIHNAQQYVYEIDSLNFKNRFIYFKRIKN